MEYTANIEIADDVFRVHSSVKAPVEWINRNYAVFLSRKKADLKVSLDPGKGIVDSLRLISCASVARKKGCLLHASAITRGKKGFIFSGPSGSGKTTIARLSERGAVLTDETAAVYKKNKDYFVGATPFAGEFGQVGKNASSNLRGIFFINKHGSFKARGVSQSEAFVKILSNCIIDTKDTLMLNVILDNIYWISKKVPAYELFFKKDKSIWRFIDGIDS